MATYFAWGLLTRFETISETSWRRGEVQMFYKCYGNCFPFDQDEGEFMTALFLGLLSYLGELNDFSDIIYDFILFWTYFWWPRVVRIFYLNFYYRPSSNSKDSKILMYFSFYSFYFLKLEPSSLSSFFFESL